MLFEKYKLIVFELNSLFDYVDNDNSSINIKYLEVIQKLKQEGKALYVLSQGEYTNHEAQLKVIHNSNLFNAVIENVGYGEMAKIELHDMVERFLNKNNVKQNEIMLVTNKKLDKYLSLDIFAVNWDEIL